MVFLAVRRPVNSTIGRQGVYDMIRFLILACIVATMCAARPVAACTCADLGPLADEYHHSSAVFVGRIVSIEISSKIIEGERVENMIATFAVERRWKGPSIRRLRVQTCGTQTLVCTCGVGFQLGQRYVVFAEGKPLQTSSGNRTHIAETAGEDLLKGLDAIAKRK
jgi:hypothetical protein